MSQNKPISNEFWQLLEHACSDTLSGEQHAELEEMLESEERLRRIYVEHFNLQAELVMNAGSERCLEAVEEMVASSKPSPPSSPVLGFLADAMSRAGSSLSRPVIALALTLVVALGSGLLILSLKDRGPIARDAGDARDASAIVAEITYSRNCQWSPATLDTIQVGGLVRGQRMQLESGVAEITFSSGARVSIEGPTTLDVVSPMAANLLVGRLAATVPESATGYAIHTPVSTVIDRGTEFGAYVQSDGTTEVHLFRGLVEVTATDRGGKPLKTQELRSGEAVRVSVDDRKIVSKPADGMLFQALASVSPQLDVPDVDLSKGLVVYLPFDGGLNDLSGHRNNARISRSSSSMSDGKFGLAVSLSGARDEYVSLGSPEELDFGTDTDFTVAFWVRIRRGLTGDAALISNKSWVHGFYRGWVIAAHNAGTGYDDLKLNAGDGQNRADANPTDTSIAHLAAGEWNLVVATFDRDGEMRVYTQHERGRGLRVLAKRMDNVGNIDTPLSLATNIGQDGAGEYGVPFAGQIDEVGIWRRVLGMQEILAIWNGGAGRPIAELMAEPGL